MSVARSPVNAWVEELAALALAEDVDLLPSTLRKIKKSGVWRSVTPLQYFAEAKSRVPAVEAALKAKQQASNPRTSTPTTGS